ncbi:Choline dehydrogenase [Rothia kristinae]|nr:Choline dehydrogenase [Rothia kristinae]
MILDGGRAVGVELEQDGEIRELRAERVVLCAGAIGSPEILLRSGIGPREHLEEIGVPVLADLPGVGANLHDHLLVP